MCPRKFGKHLLHQRSPVPVARHSTVDHGRLLHQRRGCGAVMRSKTKPQRKIAERSVSEIASRDDMSCDVVVVDKLECQIVQ